MYLSVEMVRLDKRTGNVIFLTGEERLRYIQMGNVDAEQFSALLMNNITVFSKIDMEFKRSHSRRLCATKWNVKFLLIALFYFRQENADFYEASTYSHKVVGSGIGNPSSRNPSK